MSKNHSVHDDSHHGHGSRHIYIYSPAGAVRDKAAFKRGVARLKALGHEVEVDKAALTSYQRFAGDDSSRLAAIERATASGADVALISRGGYGTTRLLSQLPYKKIAKAIERGTEFVGLSDFTALQCALFAKTGAVTWSGPTLLADLGVKDEPDEIMLACLDDLLTGQGEGSGWVLPRTRKSRVTAQQAELTQSVDFEIKKATLWGGNLRVLTSLIGTAYLPKVKGGVLFLEDVGEHPYCIERSLTQLLLAGVLDRQKAIILGQFTEYKLSPHDKGFNLDAVVQWLRSQVKVPVLTGLPMGHVPTKVLLPVGAKVSLTVGSGQALLYWGHVR